MQQERRLQIVKKDDMQQDRRRQQRRRVTIGTHVSMIGMQLLVGIGFMLLGAVGATVFICTDAEFWQTVEAFWRSIW